MGQRHHAIMLYLLDNYRWNKFITTIIYTMCNKQHTQQTQNIKEHFSNLIENNFFCFCKWLWQAHISIIFYQRKIVHRLKALYLLVHHIIKSIFKQVDKFTCLPANNQNNISKIIFLFSVLIIFLSSVGAKMHNLV